MNAPVPTGAEHLIRMVLKMIGIKPEQILEPLAQIRDIAVNADIRLTKLQTEIETLKQLLQEKRNEPRGTDE